MGSNPVFYSLPLLKIPLLPIDRRLLRCGQKIVLTFVLKNGMNIPHKEFYGLFVPFFNVVAMGVTAELIVGPAVETGGSGI